MDHDDPEKQTAGLKRQAESRAADEKWLAGLTILFGLFAGLGILKGVLHRPHIIGLLLLAVSAGLAVYYVIKEIASRRQLSAKRVGYTLIAFGVLAVLVAVMADPLGIGGEPGFGWTQGTLASTGVSVALGGVGVLRGWFAGLGPRPTPKSRHGAGIDNEA
jgi:hypothetical protein